MKYEVNCHELCWYNVTHIVEADSEEEAARLVFAGEGEITNEEFDCLDQIDIENVKKIEEDELH